MSDERKFTIRVGDEVNTDVKDYLLMVRGHDNMITTTTSCGAWAHGVMLKELALIEKHLACEDDDHEP